MIADLDEQDGCTVPSPAAAQPATVQEHAVTVQEQPRQLPAANPLAGVHLTEAQRKCYKMLASTHDGVVSYQVTYRLPKTKRRRGKGNRRAHTWFLDTNEEVQERIAEHWASRGLYQLRLPP